MCDIYVFMYISAVPLYLTASPSPSVFFLPFSRFSLTHTRARTHFALYYVYVQALRTRVSEAYTELDERTFAYRKLESSVIVFERPRRTECIFGRRRRGQSVIAEDALPTYP